MTVILDWKILMEYNYRRSDPFEGYWRVEEPETTFRLVDQMSDQERMQKLEREERAPSVD